MESTRGVKASVHVIMATNNKKINIETFAASQIFHEKWSFIKIQIKSFP